MKTGLKRPRYINQLGKFIADIGTGAVTDTAPVDDRDQAAVSLGRRGGLKGGKARAKSL